MPRGVYPRKKPGRKAGVTSKNFELLQGAIRLYGSLIEWHAKQVLERKRTGNDALVEVGAILSCAVQLQVYAPREVEDGGQNP